MCDLSSASLAGRKLYHDVWEDVGRVFLHVERLQDWASWENRFDDEIEDFESAHRCIDLMLESLDEAFTRRLSDEQVVDRKRSRKDKTGAALSARYQGIGYLRIVGFDSESITEQVETELRKIADCDGFIIDLSGNGGGLLNQTGRCCELVVERGPITAVALREENGIQRFDTAVIEDTSMRLSIAPDGTQSWKYAHRRPCLIAGKPVVVIIDGGTASSAEILARAILFNGEESGLAHSVGKRTAGKGVGQETFTYEDGTRIKVTSIRFYGADDKWFGDAGQSYWNGITPDEEVDGREEQMTAATNWLRNKLGLVVTSAA